MYLLCANSVKLSFSDFLRDRQVLTPINLSEEKNKFLDCFQNGEAYNPKYIYEGYNGINFEKLKEDILQFKLGNSPIENIFQRYLEYLLNILLLYQGRGNANNFTYYSVKTFGKPDKKIVAEALLFLQNYKKDERNNIKKDLTAFELETAFCDRLDKYGFCWEVKQSSNLAAKVSVDPDKKVISINNSINYSSTDVQRLLVHEIDTHVVRAENGMRQPFKIFASGLANSLSTEEGLAVFSEEVNNVLDNSTLRLYAGRLLAVFWSLENSFCEVFTKLLDYFDSTDAIYIIQRVKRGLTDTVEYGGFTKDYVYFEGYQKVRHYLKSNKNHIEKLYIGSVGLADMTDVEELLRIGFLSRAENITINF